MTQSVMASLSPNTAGTDMVPPGLSQALVVFLSTATLTCYQGIIVKPGSGFAETAVEWSAPSTLACEPEELCQETLLLVDVGV